MTRPAAITALLCPLLAGCGDDAQAAPLRAVGEARLRQIESPGTGPSVAGLGWVRIPAGDYWIGTPSGERGREPGELPPTRVTVERELYVSRTEVPQLAYAALVEGASWDLHAGPALPAHSTSWHDAVRFCEALDSLHPEWDFDLPTETEWEVAARGAVRAEARLLPFTCRDARIASEPAQVLKGFAFFRENSDGVLHECASKNPNPIGLFDIHGSVYEWCRVDEAVHGPRGTAHLQDEPIRGGSYLSAYRDCRAGSRAWERSERAIASIGFRVVCRRRR